MADQFPY